MDSVWYGLRCRHFTFEDRDAVVVLPDVKNANGHLVLKTEYWGAFPDVEIQLVKRGFHLAYLQNKTRFATKEDCDAKARFIDHLSKAYHLNGKCVPIGMSCGGAHAIRFAGFYPDLIDCIYIDAPVLNYQSYPGKIGNIDQMHVWDTEFTAAYPGIHRYLLPGFSEHPICMADTLIAHRIPIIMVYGTEDSTVSYDENGRLLEDAFENTYLLKTIAVPCRGHHPHGLIGDNSPIIDFILKHTQD